MRTRILTATLAVVAAPASPALGADFSLGLSGSSTGVVGQPLLIQAIGKNPPPEEYWFPTWLQVDAIPAGVISACPAEAQTSTQFVVSTGGESLAFAHRELPAADGSFTHPVGFTPKQPGRWLICGYTTVTILTTRAAASLAIEVRPATGPSSSPQPGNGQPQPPVAKPVNTGAPRVKRGRGQLVCRRGEWSNAIGAYAYAWKVNGKPKQGASGRTLRVTRRLRGRTVACSVTASNRAGATTVTSRAVRVR